MMYYFWNDKRRFEPKNAGEIKRGWQRSETEMMQLVRMNICRHVADETNKVVMNFVEHMYLCEKID